MINILKKAAQLVFADDDITPLLRVKKKDRPLRPLTERELIQLESQVGATVFGEKPAHVYRREFFNLNENTWIWHEEVRTSSGENKEMTTRYEIQPHGILKVQPGPHYKYIEGQELQNFVLAVKEYYERVSRQLYGRDPKTGQKVTR